MKIRRMFISLVTVAVLLYAPVRMGQRIAALAPHAEFMAVNGGQHTDLFDRDGAAVIARIAAFARGQR